MTVSEYAEKNGFPVADVKAANAELGGVAHPDGEVDAAKLDEHFGVKQEKPEPKPRGRKPKPKPKPAEAVAGVSGNDSEEQDEPEEIEVRTTIRPLGKREEGMKVWKVEIFGKESKVFYAWGHDEGQAIGNVLKSDSGIAGSSTSVNWKATAYQE